MKCSFKLLAWRVPVWWKEAEELDACTWLLFTRLLRLNRDSISNMVDLHDIHSFNSLKFRHVQEPPPTLTWRLSTLILVLPIELESLWSQADRSAFYTVASTLTGSQLYNERADHPGGDFCIKEKNCCVFRQPISCKVEIITHVCGISFYYFSQRFVAICW